MKKGLMSKLIVGVILPFMMIISIWGMRIMSRTDKDPAALVGVILGFFGTELLMLLIKRIFAKNDKESDNNDEPNND